MQDPAIPSLQELRALVAEHARRELVPRFGRTQSRRKADGSIVTEADVAMQAALQRDLAATWPALDFLGEEMSEQQQSNALQGSAALWCVDPLDGTTNFACGLPFFGTSVALIRNRRVELGLVYDPCRDEAFSARRGEGAWCNDHRLSSCDWPTSLGQAVALVDFKRLPPELATRLARTPPYASQRSLGSSALDWCWLASGRCQVYVHGRQGLWDYAAGQLILAEAGGHSCTLDQESVFDGSLSPRSCIGANTSQLFSQWTQWLAMP